MVAGSFGTGDRLGEQPPGPSRVDRHEIPVQAPGQLHVVADPPGPLDRFLPERTPCLRLAGEEMRGAQRPKGPAEQPLVAQLAGGLDRLFSKLPCGGEVNEESDDRGGAQHRSAPPIFAPRQDRPLADLAAGHRALHDNGAVHLLASLDGRDVGLLTIELTSPVPRLCPDGQPYIGPTATLPAARGQGVGHALVDAALTWAHDHGYQWVSVDFDTANPLSRPFWLNAGFHPAGYGVLRLIDRGAGSTPNAPGSGGGH